MNTAQKVTDPSAVAKHSTLARRDPIKRVAIFFWEGYLSVAPSLINGIRVLAMSGYEVNVITRRPSFNEFAPTPIFPSNVRIIIDGDHRQTDSTAVPHSRFQTRRVRLRNYLPQSLRARLRELDGKIRPWQDFFRFVAFSTRVVNREKYGYFIGVDMHGLVTAFLARMLKRIPVIYWSLEIRFLNEFKDRLLRLIKRFERLCHRWAALTIIQDRERASSLMIENKTQNSAAIIVPNGPLGWPEIKSTDFFQRRFNLSHDKRIVLHLGMISPAVLSREIAVEGSKWPDDCVLVFHDRAKRDADDNYLFQVQRAGAGRVLLSLDPVPYDELDSVVMSAHIGLVFYQKELGPNFAQMAGASGKLAHYLKCGLPVICLDLPGFVEIVDRYKCGICVSEPNKIKLAADAIFSNFDYYRRNALKCYEECYEFGRHFRQVLDTMEKLNRFENGSCINGNG